MSAVKIMLAVGGVAVAGVLGYTQRHRFTGSNLNLESPAVKALNEALVESEGVWPAAKKAAAEKAAAEAKGMGAAKIPVVKVVPMGVRAVVQTDSDEMAKCAQKLEQHLEETLPSFDRSRWDGFVSRLSSKPLIHVDMSQDLLAMKSTLPRGYSVVVLPVGEYGIVHVTKQGINALFPVSDNTYHVVSNNQRFAGKRVVDNEAASMFLGGRY